MIISGKLVARHFHVSGAEAKSGHHKCKDDREFERVVTRLITQTRTSVNREQEPSSYNVTSTSVVAERGSMWEVSG
jgi:hypothetical protein